MLHYLNYKPKDFPVIAASNPVCYCYTGCNVIDIHFTFTRDGRPSGEAYIELATEQDVHVALSKNQQHMGKRYIEGTVIVFCGQSPIVWLFSVTRSSEVVTLNYINLKNRACVLGPSKLWLHLLSPE